VVKQDRLPFPGPRKTCHAVEGPLKVIAGVCGGAGSCTRFLPVFERARARNDLLYSAVTEGCIGGFFHTWRSGRGAPTGVNSSGCGR
jgi:hypothetical protein